MSDNQFNRDELVAMVRDKLAPYCNQQISPELIAKMQEETRNSISAYLQQEHERIMVFAKDKEAKFDNATIEEIFEAQRKLDEQYPRPEKDPRFDSRKPTGLYPWQKEVIQKMDGYFTPNFMPSLYSGKSILALTIGTHRLRHGNTIVAPKRSGKSKWKSALAEIMARRRELAIRGTIMLEESHIPSTHSSFRAHESAMHLHEKMERTSALSIFNALDACNIKIGKYKVVRNTIKLCAIWDEMKIVPVSMDDKPNSFYLDVNRVKDPKELLPKLKKKRKYSDPRKTNTIKKRKKKL